MTYVVVSSVTETHDYSWSVPIMFSSLVSYDMGNLISRILPTSPQTYHFNLHRVECEIE